MVGDATPDHTGIIKKGRLTTMRLRFPAALAVVVSMLLVVGIAEAGHYTKSNATIFLNGQVLLRFDELQIGTSNDGNAMEWLRYSVRALKGKAMLINVEYQDSALNGRETVRWTQSATPLNCDISNRYNYLDKDTRALVKERCELKMRPCDLETARIRFHLQAAGRQFIVIWRPKSGEVYATW